MLPDFCARVANRALVSFPEVSSPGLPSRPNGAITLLLSNISTSSSNALALARHDEILSDAAAANGGIVFRAGRDGSYAAFPDVAGAIATALAVQGAILAEPWSAVDGVRARMALHTGTAEERNGDYYGPAVNRATRLLSIAHGGQVVVSGVAADLIQGALPKQVSLYDLGAHRLKDLAYPEQVYQLNAPILEPDFPPPRSLAAVPNNLPLRLSSFLGREAEVAAVEGLLETNRVVSLVGPSGVGKTRAALQVGADLLDEFPDGVWLVEFGSIVDASLVPATLANVLDVRDPGGDLPLIDAIATALRSKRALLIFSDCEHLASSIAVATDRIVRQCPGIKLLVTAREGLGVAGEAIFLMPSLAVPPATGGLTAAGAMQFAAVALFAARAQAARPDFRLHARNVRAVAAICARLDGIALAIELAASRVRVVEVEALAKRLEDRFRLLTGGTNAQLPRQQTLRALIGWTYEALSEPEKSLLRQLSIFRGGCSLDAARVICVDERFEAYDVVDLLAGLAAASLVVVEYEGEEQRYRIVDATRQYALERLGEADERHDLATRHAEYYRNAVRALFESRFHTNLDPWTNAARRDLDNYRAAIVWGLIEGNDPESGAYIAAALAPFWNETSFYAEGCRYIRTAAALPAGTLSEETLALIHMGAGLLFSGREAVAHLHACLKYASEHGNAEMECRTYALLGGELAKAGRLEEAFPHLERALEIARRLKIRRLLALTLTTCGTWYGDRTGDFLRARTLLQESLQILRAVGDTRRLTDLLLNLAEIQFSAGDLPGAIATAREVMERVDEGMNEFSRNMVFGNLAGYLLASGNLDEGSRYAFEAMEISVRRGDSYQLASAFDHVANSGAQRGEFKTAARIAGCADRLYDELRGSREPTELDSHRRTMALLREALANDELATLTAEGRTLDEAAAVAMARDLQGLRLG